MSSVSSAPREFYRDYCTDPKEVAKRILDILPVADAAAPEEDIRGVERLLVLRQGYAQNPSVPTLAGMVDLAAYVMRTRLNTYEGMLGKNGKFPSLLRNKLSGYFPNLDADRSQTRKFCNGLNAADRVEILMKNLPNVWTSPSWESEGMPALVSGSKDTTTRAEEIYLQTENMKLQSVPYTMISHIRLPDPSDESPLPLPAAERAQARALVEAHLLPELADMTFSYLPKQLNLQDHEDLCERLKGFVYTPSQ